MTDKTSTPAADLDPISGKPFHEDDTVALRVQNAVLRSVRTITERQSPTEFFMKPAYEGDPYPDRKPKATAELKALVALRGQVESSIYWAVRSARGEGTTWLDIAQLLGITDDQDRPDAEMAYYSVMPQEDNWGLTRPNFGYTCGSCKASIQDYGPFESHPVDNERGHTEDCARFNGLVDAWRAAHPD